MLKYVEQNPQTSVNDECESIRVSGFYLQNMN